MSIAASLVGEDAKTKFLSKMGQLTTSGAMLANVFQRKKWAAAFSGVDFPWSFTVWGTLYLKSIVCLYFVRLSEFLIGSILYLYLCCITLFQPPKICTFFSFFLCFIVKVLWNHHYCCFGSFLLFWKCKEAKYSSFPPCVVLALCCSVSWMFFFFFFF